MPGAEHAKGLGLHLCRDLGRVRLCRLRGRRLHPLYRGLTGEQNGGCQLRAGRFRAGDP
jgi:hypothetical protein